MDGVTIIRIEADGGKDHILQPSNSSSEFPRQNIVSTTENDDLKQNESAASNAEKQYMVSRTEIQLEGQNNPKQSSDIHHQEDSQQQSILVGYDHQEDSDRPLSVVSVVTDRPLSRISQIMSLDRSASSADQSDRSHLLGGSPDSSDSSSTQGSRRRGYGSIKYSTPGVTRIKISEKESASNDAMSDEDSERLKKDPKLEVPKTAGMSSFTETHSRPATPGAGETNALVSPPYQPSRPPSSLQPSRPASSQSQRSALNQSPPPPYSGQDTLSQISVLEESRWTTPEGEGASPAPIKKLGEMSREVPTEDLPTIIPDEPVKTFVSFLILLFGFLATTISLSITHELVPIGTHLPDVFIDNTQRRDWGMDATESILLTMIGIAGLTALFHKHRMVVFRRIFLVAGMLYTYRGITMYVTNLPNPDSNYLCKPKYNHTITFSQVMKRTWKILQSGGLNFSDDEIDGVQTGYCGDYMFSGHTMILFTAFFTIREYSPRRFFLLHGFILCAVLSALVFMLLGRGHYTLDVLVAYWVTSRVWWVYHTLAHNNNLKEHGEHNYVSNIWWWYIFRYFEENVPGPLPRVYSLPLPRFLSYRVESAYGVVKEKFVVVWNSMGEVPPPVPMRAGYSPVP